jgi:hypothetical protein
MRRTLALLFTLLVASGCSNNAEQPPPAATLPSQVTTSSTAPAAPDPAVIPEDLSEIDEAYVQAVVDELFAVEAKAAEIFIRTRTLDEQALDYLRAIYTEDEFERQRNIWFQALALRPDEMKPGTLRHEIDRVIDVRPGCVYIRAVRDYSETATRDVTPEPIYLGLTPASADATRESLNPTAWLLFMNGVNPDGSEPENPCAGR